jgi:hypothetical protein
LASIDPFDRCLHQIASNDGALIFVIATASTFDVIDRALRTVSVFNREVTAGWTCFARGTCGCIRLRGSWRTISELTSLRSQTRLRCRPFPIDRTQRTLQREIHRRRVGGFRGRCVDVSRTQSVRCRGTAPGMTARRVGTKLPTELIAIGVAKRLRLVHKARCHPGKLGKLTEMPAAWTSSG